MTILLQHSWFRCWHWPVLGLIGLVLGCDNRPKPIPAPKWDPDGMSSRAISEYDKNADGKLSVAELAAAPGLAWSLETMDTDGDKQLSKEELQARLKLYQDMRTGLLSYQLAVLYRNNPLPGAEVKLVPESFLGDVVPTASGRTGPNGWVTPAVPGQENDPCMKPGFYRIEVTAPNVKIAEKFNTQTTIGVEVAPVTDTKRSGIPRFDVGKR